VHGELPRRQWQPHCINFLQQQRLAQETEQPQEQPKHAYETLPRSRSLTPHRTATTSSPQKQEVTHQLASPPKLRSSLSDFNSTLPRSHVLGQEQSMQQPTDAGLGLQDRDSAKEQDGGEGNLTEEASPWLSSAESSPRQRNSKNNVAVSSPQDGLSKRPAPDSSIYSWQPVESQMTESLHERISTNEGRSCRSQDGIATTTMRTTNVSTSLAESNGPSSAASSSSRRKFTC
jgi:hypothetical protein